MVFLAQFNKTSWSLKFNFIYLTLFPIIFGLSGYSYAKQPVELTLCQSCHGKDLSGNKSLGAPNLTILSESYLTQQLKSFKTGRRGSNQQDRYGAQMSATVANLTDEQFDSLAAEISRLSPQSATSVLNEKSNDPTGQNIFVSNCAACHHSSGKGNEALKAPALAGQQTDYLYRQINNFRNGLRGTAADDKSGRQMAMMAKTLRSEADARAVINYISQLTVNDKQQAENQAQ